MQDVRTGLAVLPPPVSGILFRGMDGMSEELTYEELIAPVRERMMRIVWRIVRDPDEAEDTMQEILTVIWKKPDGFSDRPSPPALVLKICVDRAVDALRRRQRQRRFVDPQILDRLPASESGDGWEGKETEAMVREAISRLPRKQAVAVLLRVRLKAYFRRPGFVNVSTADGTRPGPNRRTAATGSPSLSAEHPKHPGAGLRSTPAPPCPSAWKRSRARAKGSRPFSAGFPGLDLGALSSPGDLCRVQRRRNPEEQRRYLK